MKSEFCKMMMPESPVTYTWKQELGQDGGKYAMTFRSGFEIWNRCGGADGFVYDFNGRGYQDVESLWKETLEEIYPDVRIGMDAYGERVLRAYTDIPTFDSSDREWDSRMEEYLFYDGKQIHLVVLRGGYRIAKLIFYTNLLTADVRMKPTLEKMGWPVSQICWR